MTVSRNELAKICDELRDQGKTIVFTNGCFDILHRGHVQYLREAKELGDILIVGLNSDSSVTRIKGPERPIMPESDRAFILNGLKSVDFVCIFDEDTPFELIKALKPHILVKGADYADKKIVGAEFVQKHGGKVALINVVEGKSTTSIIDKIRKMD